MVPEEEHVCPCGDSACTPDYYPCLAEDDWPDDWIDECEGRLQSDNFEDWGDGP
jgi:hypothetical protein